MKILRWIFVILGLAIFFLSSLALFEPGADPTGFFTYVPGIAIVNPDNNAAVGGNLEIKFITKGTNDLVITPSGNFEFVELNCGGVVLNPYVEDGRMFITDYACDKESSLIIKVLSEQLEVEFKFGIQGQTAENIA